MGHFPAGSKSKYAKLLPELKCIVSSCVPAAGNLISPHSALFHTCQTTQSGRPFRSTCVDGSTGRRHSAAGAPLIEKSSVCGLCEYSAVILYTPGCFTLTV